MSSIRHLLRHTWALMVSSVFCVISIAMDYPNHLGGSALLAAFLLGFNLMGVLMHQLYSAELHQADRLRLAALQLLAILKEKR